MLKEAVEAYFKALRNPEHSCEITKNLKTEYLMPQARSEPDKTQFSLPVRCMSRYCIELASTAFRKLLRIREFPIYQPDFLKFLHFPLRLVYRTGIPWLASSITGPCNIYVYSDTSANEDNSFRNQIR